MLCHVGLHSSANSSEIHQELGWEDLLSAELVSQTWLDFLGICVPASNCAIQHVDMKLSRLVRYNSQASEHCSKVLTIKRSAMHTLDSLFTRAWPGVGVKRASWQPMSLILKDLLGVMDTLNRTRWE